MAHETSAPHIKTILTIAAISVAVLVFLDVALKSYYITMTEDEEFAQVLGRPTTELNKLRAAEQQRLTSGAMPIDKAMQALGARGLDNPAARKVAGVDLSPDPSNDQGPLVGWNLLAKDGGAQAAPSDAGAILQATGDGGEATLTGEGGVTTAAGEAGVAASDAQVQTTATDAATTHLLAPAPVATEAGTH